MRDKFARSHLSVGGKPKEPIDDIKVGQAIAHLKLDENFNDTYMGIEYELIN